MCSLSSYPGIRDKRGRPTDARYLANSLTVVQLALMTNLEDRFGAGERQRALLHAAEGVRRGRLRRWSCCWVCNRWMRVLSGVVDLGRSSGAVSIRVAVGVPAGEFGPAAPTTPGRCAGMQSARGAAPHVPDVNGLLDRLVRDPHRLIIGEVDPELVGNLLRTPCVAHRRS